MEGANDLTKHFFTSESVTEGHPDKVADQIADSILDAILEQDPVARVAVETSVCTGLVLVCGEVTTSCYVDINKKTRETIKNIGYTRAKYGFDGDTCGVLVSIDEQSPDIAMGVNHALEVRKGTSENDLETMGAGDQGLMFGYACNETEELMPLPITLAHRLTKRLAEARKKREILYLRPDGKSQVTVQYEDDRPVRIEAIVVSTQHHPDVSQSTIEEDVYEEVIKKVIPPELMDKATKIYINPTGRFVLGGPQADSGLTGRKIIADTYGGMARHGGGSFSGKDPTKVDRSASYAARWVAKNIVAAGLARRCEVSLAYAIGVAHPIAIEVDTFGTGLIADERLAEIVRDSFDLRPAAIIRDLDLRKPIYTPVSVYGHFGRSDLDLSWERLNKVELLKEKAGL